ncbi:MAG: protein phosphatase 2C domain-containing protein [Planctomycetota bacterium]
MAPKFRVDHAALTDLGMRRANNQDSISAPDAGCEVNGRGEVFMVADGMGAHAAGELASKLATDCIPHAYRKLGDLPPQAALRQAVQKANGLIHAKGQSSPEFQGMGTTSSCLLLLGDAALVAHVGDSRVYRLRGGQLDQLTFDHSLVWEMAAASQTTADQVPDCIPKNVITRSLGPHNKVNVDLEGPHPLADGDAFLICSDGLTGVVEDHLIGALVGAMPPEEAGQTLIDLANLRGGPDNISVVIARVDDESEDSGSGAAPTAPSRFRGGLQRLALLASASCLLAVFWFVSQRHGLGALLASAGFGASAMVAWMQRGAAVSTPAVSGSLGGPYGNGPYRTIDCEPGDAAAAALADVVEQLAELEHRDGAEPSPPVENWKPFQELRHKAIYAADTGDPAAAVIHYAAAIRELMDQVRAGRTVDYDENRGDAASS